MLLGPDILYKKSWFSLLFVVMTNKLSGALMLVYQRMFFSSMIVYLSPKNQK